MELWMYLIIAIEVFYWFIWIPKNWRNNRECVHFVDAIKGVYGKPVKRKFEVRRWENPDFSIGESFWIDNKKVSYQQFFCEKHNLTYIPKDSD